MSISTHTIVINCIMIICSSTKYISLFAVNNIIIIIITIILILLLLLIIIIIITTVITTAITTILFRKEVFNLLPNSSSCPD